MKPRLLFLCATLIVFSSACSSIPVKTNHDPEVDFSVYSSYAWIFPGEGAESEQVLPDREIRPVGAPPAEEHGIESNCRSGALAAIIQNTAYIDARKYFLGFTDSPSRSTSKCRWAPVERPVLPTVATTSPFSTRSPAFTMASRACA